MAPARIRSFLAVVIALVAVVVVVTLAARPQQHVSADVPAACRADLSDLGLAPPISEDVIYAWHLGRRVGFPVVRADIAGCAVRVLLDTGVSTPVLAPWFAERLALPLRPAGGRALDIGGFESGLEETDPLVVELPATQTNGSLSTVLAGDTELREYGIAAIVPPQFAVAPGRVYALDLAGGTYRRLSPADVDALALGTPTFTASSECNGELLVPAFVEGRPATLLLDTGSVISTLYSESDAGGPIAARVGSWERRERTPFGGAQDESVVYGVGIRVGDMAGTMPMSVIRRPVVAPDDACAFDGALGMDFLVDRHCVLLFDLGAEVPDHPGQFYGRVRGYCRP